MRIQLLPFGVLKEVLSPAPLDLPEETTVSELIAILSERMRHEPVVTQLLPRIAVSVNAEYAQAEQVLHEGDEVGLLPPVSGGSGQPAVVTYLTREAIPADELVAEAKEGSDGAVCVFDGIVRDNTRGRRTLYLDYESYREMALEQMRGLATEAVTRFGVRDVAVLHRLGRLNIGETSVLIVVASAHRGAAFEVCRWLIDSLKKTVPIWKKEYFEDGAMWADGEAFPEEIQRAAGTMSHKPASK